MKGFIFGEKNSIHIIDLTQTVNFLKTALVEVHKCISSGGKILIVSTKKQASEQVSTLAKDTSQYYVNYRWLGGMLTNWNTIQNSIKRLKHLEDQLSKDNMGFTKKEIIKFGKERDKLQRSLGGIAEMKKIPNMIFIIDTNIESLAVNEAKKLGIPIIGVLDTNSDPTGIDFPIPGNDDARRSIDLYCSLIKETIISAKMGLLTLFEYEPSLYIDEINEIIECIAENKIYDNAPNLEQIELVNLLESLKVSLISEAYPDLNIQKFHELLKESLTTKKYEEKIRVRVRKILLRN